MPVHQAPVVCGFCKLGTDVNDVCGLLHKGYVKNGMICAAHHRCMQYSYFLGQYKFKKFGGFKIGEVVKEVKRAKKLKCMLCKKSKNSGGASSKCGYYYCNRTFHYYCVQTNEKCFTRRICLRRQKCSRPVILYRTFCSKEHERKFLNRRALFQEAFNGVDSCDDDLSDSSGESENDCELIEDVFNKKQAEKAALRSTPKPKPVGRPKELSRAERLKMREQHLQGKEIVTDAKKLRERLPEKKIVTDARILRGRHLQEKRIVTDTRKMREHLQEKKIVTDARKMRGQHLQEEKIVTDARKMRGQHLQEKKIVTDARKMREHLQEKEIVTDARKMRRQHLQEKKMVTNAKKEICTRNTRNSISQKENAKDEENQSRFESMNCNNFTKLKCSKSKCLNINTIPKVLNNRILSVSVEKLSDSVFNMNDISTTVSKNDQCIQNLVDNKSGRTNLFRRSKRNNHCKISSGKCPRNFCGESDCRKPQSVVKISGSCRKMVKEVRQGLFGDPVGALIQICLEKLPLDRCVQGSINLLDEKSSKPLGQQESQTDLVTQETSINGADYLQVQDKATQIDEPEVSSEETLEMGNELFLAESTGRNTSEYQHQYISSDQLENGCSGVEFYTQTEPALIGFNSTPLELHVVPDDEEENGPANLQVEDLSVDLANCTELSSQFMSSQEQETMVLCICRDKKADLQNQSRILRICKNRYQASKMNVFFWDDIMPPSFKPEYLPYFFLDIVECLRLKMYEDFFTLLFSFDQKHSEKFQYLIDIEDETVIKEQEDKIWMTVASYLKKASLDSGKEVGILLSLDEQEVMLLPINEVNDSSCRIRRELLCLRSQSRVMDSSIRDVSQEAYILKSWLQVNLQDRYQVFYKPDDDVISLSELENSCTNQLYMYLKQHALNTATGNGFCYGKQTILDFSDKMDYVLCIGSVNTDIVNYSNYCENALLQFITKIEDRCMTIYCILDIGEARGISQAFQILPKNEIWQGQVEVFSAVVPGAKLNYCVILKIVPFQLIYDPGNVSPTEKCKKRLGEVSAVVNGEKRAKF